MSPRPPQGSAAANSNAYIPSNVQQAMSRQLQETVPAHLKQYVGSNPPSDIPVRVQAELAGYMEKALPSHLQGYADAYVQQNIIDTNKNLHKTVMDAPNPEVKVRPTVMNRRNLSHSSAVGGAQADALQMLNIMSPPGGGTSRQPSSTAFPQPQPLPTAAAAFPDQPASPSPVLTVNPAAIQAAQATTNPTTSAIAPPTAEQLAAPTDPNYHYDFIMNPETVKKHGTSGGTGKRLAVVGAVGLFLIIALMVFSSLLKGGGGPVVALTGVEQEQTELLRVAALGPMHSSTPQVIETSNLVTINVLSAQNQLSGYLISQKIKIDPKQLGLKHSLEADKAMNASLTTNTFDAVYSDILQNDLTSYALALKTAYAASSGPKGRAILKSQYANTALLLEQAKQ